jgi:hypothetical protein
MPQTILILLCAIGCIASGNAKSPYVFKTESYNQPTQSDMRQGSQYHEFNRQWMNSYDDRDRYEALFRGSVEKINKPWRKSRMVTRIEDLQYACCYCNEGIQSDKINPCDVNILVNIDKPKEKQDNQTFWCHVECFKKTLHPYMRSYFVVDIIEDDE